MFGTIKFEGDWINDDCVDRLVWIERDGRILGTETITTRRYVAWKGYEVSSQETTAAFAHIREAQSWTAELHNNRDVLRAQARMAGVAYVVPLSSR